MKPGDRVQVKTAWAAQGPGLPPLMTWMSGYEWVRLVDSDTALVRHLKGPFTGCNVNHPVSHVRLE